jgi:hypothetical protein
LKTKDRVCKNCARVHMTMKRHCLAAELLQKLRAGADIGSCGSGEPCDGVAIMTNFTI